MGKITKVHTSSPSLKAKVVSFVIVFAIVGIIVTLHTMGLHH